MSATLMEAPAGLIPMKLLVELGRTNMSMPMPLVRSLKPLSLPIRMAVMERIMMTSMAIARQLMSERKGRWTRLPTTSLFIQLPVYGSGRANEVLRHGTSTVRRTALRSCAQISFQRELVSDGAYFRRSWGQPAWRHASDRLAAATHDAFRTDEEGSNYGHEVGAQHRSEDDCNNGVDAHVDDGADVSFGSCVGVED